MPLRVVRFGVVVAVGVAGVLTMSALPPANLANPLSLASNEGHLARNPEVALPQHVVPRAVHKPAKPRVRHPVRRVQPHTTGVRTVVSGPTSWSALNAAIARIPNYRPGIARWVISNTGWWATTDWYHSIVYISPTTPRSKLFDVVVHEWGHVLTMRDYGGDVAAATRATAAYFGGSGLTGAERAADCMAILQGAHWTHYTSCTSSSWRAGARRLLDGQPL